MSLAMLLASFAAVLVLNGCAPRGASASGACINGLRQIDGAREQWILEHHKATNAVPTWEDLYPYLIKNTRCPQGGTYTLGRDGPHCSIPAHEKFWIDYKRGN